jgi:ssDNA thymidine ADP-ribosyltransferase, DarT
MRPVPIAPRGTLGDYVPFYFTPHSPMLYNIRTGYGGIVQRSNDEIVILVSSLHELVKARIPFVFTDRHAYLSVAKYYSKVEDLDHLDWSALQSRNFRRDPEDPERMERYQAEALAYRHVPLNALIGIACHSERMKTELERMTAGNDQLRIRVRSHWYFR